MPAKIDLSSRTSARSLRLGFASRTGDLVLTTSPPSTFREVSTAQRVLIAAGGVAGWTPGLHGYDTAAGGLPYPVAQQGLA